MKSTLVLYEDSQILIDKNIKVDSLETYLNGLTKTTFNNLNLIKPTRELKLKVELNQTNITIGEDNPHNYNYACITTDGMNYYYFIKNYEWISLSVISLDLYMDTINTFVFKNQGDSGSADYIITPKSLIHRQHKDRWEFDEESQIVPLTPLIDKTAEGITPELYREGDNVIEDSLQFNSQKWYIIYMNANPIDPDKVNQVNPVNVYITPQYTTPVVFQYLLNIDTGDLEAGKYYSLSNLMKYLEDYNITLSAGAYADWSIKKYFGTIGGASGLVYDWIELYRATGSNDMTIRQYKSVVNSQGVVLSTQMTREVSNVSSLHSSVSDAFPLQYGIHKASSHVVLPSKTSVLWKSDYTEGIASTIDAVDKTDSRLIKIVELPYCPIPSFMENHSLGFTRPIYLYSPFTNTDIKVISVAGLSGSALEGTKRIYYENDIIIDKLVIPNLIMDAIDAYEHNRFYSDNAKSMYLESKLASSEFYSVKLIYDSFSMEIKSELVSMFETLFNVSDSGDGVSLSMITPTTITSKFGFKLKGLILEKSIEDYPLFLPIARNNESPIYTSQYINYLRTGFNYDLKAKNQQATASGMSIGLATLGAVAGVGLGIASNNPAVLAGSVISAITAVTSAVTSAVNTAITNQRSIEQKLAQAKAQAVSIQASDDLDLLNAYANGNRAKICHYIPSEEMRQNIFDLFYYTGYAVERLGLPDTISRMRFNYVSADIDIIMQKHLPKDIVDDIKARWSLGITFMHKLTTDLTRYPYNFEQDLENWEWSLEDAIQISE